VADNGIARLIDLCERDNDVTVGRADLGGRGAGAGARSLRSAGETRRAADAVERRRQLHQHVFDPEEPAPSPACCGVDARESRFPSVAGAVGSITEPVLKCAAFSGHRIDNEPTSRPPTPRAAWRSGGGNVQVAILLSQRWSIAPSRKAIDRGPAASWFAPSAQSGWPAGGRQHRLANRIDVAACGDDARNFYIWSGLGCTPMVGLGLASGAGPKAALPSSPADGDVLMALGSLRHHRRQATRRRLRIVCLDTAHAGGMQPRRRPNQASISRRRRRPANLRVEAVSDCPAPICLTASGRGRLHPRSRRWPTTKRVIPSRDGRRDQASLHAGAGFRF